ncbi:MAG: hypothetical protein C0424_04170 [Sphingobacteriaceae bacterium]|nr:hypothetical protein [Sphingobacteriaceae bacterium]
MKALHEQINCKKGDDSMLLFASLLEQALRAPAQLRSSAGQKAPFTRRWTKLGHALIDPVVQRLAVEGTAMSFYGSNSPTPRFSAVKMSSHVN